MKTISYLVLFAVLVTSCKATGLLDLLKWGLDMGAPSFGREAEAEDGSVEGEEENCECEHGLSCNCCIRLNFTLIDFGEPGCVNIQYAAFDQSLEFNMTFGENELHSQSVDVDSIEPVCMNLVGDVPIAYICATLSKFKLAGDRMRGCVHLEPSILGETQARYFVGCFGQGNDTRNGTRVTGPGKVSSKVGNKTSSGENASVGSTGSASVETSGEASSSSGEDEDDSDPTDPAAGGYIEQGANILSNLFYYFSPDSPEEEGSDASKPEKIVLVSSTEVAGKEDAGASELPPPASSEEYDSTGAGSDDGEEEEDESAGGETSESGPSGPSAPGASDGSASAGR